MERIIKNFVNYLFDFVIIIIYKGLINVNSVKDFLSIYDKLNGKSFNVNKMLSSLLFEYFVNLNEGNLEKICDEVTAKFIENEKIQKQKSLNNLIKSYNRVALRNKQDCFFHFKIKLLTNIDSKYFLNKIGNRIQSALLKKHLILLRKISRIYSYS
jgi:hypothetical protein